MSGEPSFAPTGATTNPSAGQKQNVKLKIENVKSTFYMFSCLLLSFVAYHQFLNLATKSRRGRRFDVLLSSPVLCGLSSILNLATKSSRGRRCRVDVLLSSPVLCGLPSILNLIIQDSSCLEEAKEGSKEKRNRSCLVKTSVRVDAACRGPKAERARRREKCRM